MTEFCANGDLQHYLTNNPNLGHRACVQIGLDVALGMAWLAHENFVHRDLKPQNVLVKRDGQASTTTFPCKAFFDTQLWALGEDEPSRVAASFATKD